MMTMEQKINELKRQYDYLVMIRQNERATHVLREIWKLKKAN